ncbi:hypothetical protein PUMCH_002701 [Australozyma saopauloensis]|uniref:Uncharacterized protein n=1 Tax=Australozyma saopauloensis TaxID=291208 RepID=A0AAX4H9Z8_9ASCO|nr:hypothetical protein PUMCH_002701 [[Candida] saopauloensis]
MVANSTYKYSKPAHELLCHYGCQKLTMINGTSYAPYDFDGFPAIKGLAYFLLSLLNGAGEGTGIKTMLKWAKNITGEDISPILIDYYISIQYNLFGGYPNKSDFVPSIVFTVIFAVLMLLHLLVFGINTSRGHHFIISLVWSLNCAAKLVGFALRAVWAKDITQLNVGLTSEILLIIPSIIFASFDLILAQRLFTWRHPVGGSRKLFWGVMLLLYAVVAILVGITIAAAFIPYLYTLSPKAYSSWKRVNMFTSVMVIVYSLTAMALIGLSYLFPPTAKDENLYTYQPWWIESFAPFYFVEPGAAQKAEETFMKRNHNHRHAIRVIAATHHHYNMVEGLTNKRGTLKHNVSMALICTTTVLIFIGSIGRAISLFQNRLSRHASSVCNPVFMYICWGGFEALINVLYLVGRVDLRFYRPDILPIKVRQIITAEQSHYVSEAEESDTDEEPLSRFSSGLSFKPHIDAPNSPPYPRDDYLREKHDVDNDNISDFHF